MESAQSVCWMRLTIFCLSLHRRYETSICPSDDERRSTIGNNRWVFLGLSSVYSSDILLTIYLLLSVCRFWRYTNASATSAQTTPSFWNAVGKLLLRCFFVSFHWHIANNPSLSLYLQAWTIHQLLPSPTLCHRQPTDDATLPWSVPPTDRCHCQQ